MMPPALPDDRERLTPIPLPAEEPVPQLVIDHPPSKSTLLENPRDFVLRFRRRQTIERAAVDGESLTDETVERLHAARTRSSAQAQRRRWAHHLADRQRVLSRKLP